MKKIIIAQFWVLLLGTIFAWANLAYEFILWFKGKSSPVACNPLTGQTVTPGVVNPFLTPCFYGALFFLVAFILNIIIKRSKNLV